MQIGYARVSTKEQSFDLQFDALRKAGCGKVFQEVVGGAKAERPVLEALLADLCPGDVLVVWKYSLHLLSHGPSDQRIWALRGM